MRTAQANWPELLDKIELRLLTGATRADAQAAWLAAQGLPHRRDGARVIVSRHHVRLWLEGKQAPRSSGINWNAPGMAGEGPNWAALNAPKPKKRREG